MRKFGIEVELGLQPGSTRTQVSNALRAAGLGGQLHQYAGHSESHWVVKEDASVRNGVELVSPPLNFDSEADREQVTTALKAVKDLCRPVPAAGIHVHVESRQLSAEQVANVARTFHHFEDVLYRIASSGWRTIRGAASTFAHPLTTRQAEGLAKAKTNEQVMDAYYGPGGGWAASSHSHNSRYCAVNLHSHFYRGTIEFRLFNSSLNATRVQTYIAICVAIVNDAKNGHKRSVNKRAKLGDMANGQANEKQLFHHFQQVMVGDHVVIGQPGGMSRKDYKNLNKLWKDSQPQQSMGAY